MSRMSHRIGSGEGTDMEFGRKLSLPVHDLTTNDLNDSEEGSVQAVQERAGEEDPIPLLFATPLSHWNAGQKWLSVPRALRFIHSGVEGIFEAKIRIQNMTSWNISYCVRSSSVDKLAVKDRTGWIAPHKQMDVIVMSRPGTIKDFGSLCRENLAVIGTPVHFASQLHKKKIRLLWKAYGSKLFPFDAAEVHKVDQMIPAEDSYMDNYNIMEKCSLGNYVAGANKIHMELPDKPVDADTFYDNWSPTEDPRSILLKMNCHFKEWKMAMKYLNEQTDTALISCKYLLATFVSIGFYYAMMSIVPQTLSFQGRLLGPNALPFYPVEPAAAELTPWWKFF